MFREMVHKADLQNGYYLNPILDGDYPDPAVMREGRDFYLCVSTADYFPGLTIFHSCDLVNWHTLCHLLRSFASPVWAPDILKYGDIYYIYFCSAGSNWVMHSPQIDRGWSEPIDLGIPKYLDPAHCADDAGNRYLFVSKNHLIPLTPDGLSCAGPMEQVLDAPKIPDEWDVEGAFPEAPNIFRRDGYYYLTYADGGTTGPATSHMIMAARSRNLHGPWELSPYNPVVHTFYREEAWVSKGHGHFVDDADGNWWVIYHAYENGCHASGRKLLLSPVEFTKDGWFTILAPADMAAKKPAGIPTGIVDTLCDDFQPGPMPPQWRAKGYLDPARIHRTEKGLVFQGVDSTPGASNPLTVITGDKSFEIETEVSLAAPGAAGLIYLYDTNLYNSLSFTGTELIIHRTGKPLARIPFAASKCVMKLRIERGYLSFWYQDTDGRFQKLNYVIDTSAQNTLAYGGFLSLRPGIFSAGQGTARFSYFKYVGLQ